MVLLKQHRLRSEVYAVVLIDYSLSRYIIITFEFDEFLLKSHDN